MGLLESSEWFYIILLNKNLKDFSIHSVGMLFFPSSIEPVKVFGEPILKGGNYFYWQICRKDKMKKQVQTKLSQSHSVMQFKTWYDFYRPTGGCSAHICSWVTAEHK